MCEADGYGDGIIFASFVCGSLAEHGERSPASSKGNQRKRSSSERALRKQICFFSHARFDGC